MGAWPGDAGGTGAKTNRDPPCQGSLQLEACLCICTHTVTPTHDHTHTLPPSPCLQRPSQAPHAELHTSGPGVQLSVLGAEACRAGQPPPTGVGDHQSLTPLSSINYLFFPLSVPVFYLMCHKSSLSRCHHTKEHHGRRGWHIKVAEHTSPPPTVSWGSPTPPRVAGGGAACERSLGSGGVMRAPTLG